MRRHWALAALLACATPLLLAFTAQGGLASLGDDSASYLALARYFARDGSPAAHWAPYFGHFPPLFPLVLALTGAAHDLARAHAVVALAAAAGVAALYAHAWAVHRDRLAAAGLALVFLALPTAWISAKGILTEPLFLALTLATLAFHQARLAQGRGTYGEWLLLGALLAACMLTRLAAAPLAAAIALQAAIRMARSRRFRAAPWLLAGLPLVLALAAWALLRPGLASDPYSRATGSIAALWLARPGTVAGAAAANFVDGWIATFTADPAVAAAARAVAVAAGLAGIAGAVRAALANRADGWYALGALALVFAWLFDADNMRRLLYPLVPLLLLHAGEFIAASLAWAGATVRARRFAVAVCALALGLVALPAMLLIADKAGEREPVLAGFAPRYADMTDYYTSLDGRQARSLAAKHAAVLSGLEALGRATPAGARVMWMRPEYVALLGGREGVPWYYTWDAKRMAREVRDARVDYLVVARLHKTDLAGGAGDPFATLRGVEAYSHPVLVLPNAVAGGDEFVLLAVDRERLAAYLGSVF